MRNIHRQLFSLILPFTAIALVPLLVETNWQFSADVFSITGLFFVVVGAILLIGMISMFIRIGKGTLAPWSPTSRLVRSGVYAHTRNPMIGGVLSILLGESLLFHSVSIFIWFACFFIINSVYFILSEEPRLFERFGGEYVEYKKNVPKWIPRLRAWKPWGANGNAIKGIN